MTERRRFIATAGGALATVAAAATVDAPYVIAQPKIQWRMSTAWTPALDILQGAAQRLAKVVEEMSGGRFRIEVFPGGQIMPPFDCFDAASKGTVEAFMASPQYWKDKEPALEWFATIPFGMNPEGMAAWYYQGEGLGTGGPHFSWTAGRRDLPHLVDPCLPLGGHGCGLGPRASGSARHHSDRH